MRITGFFCEKPAQRSAVFHPCAVAFFDADTAPNVQKEVRQMAVKANYETVMVLSVKNGEDAVHALVEKFTALIEKHATLQSVDEWGKRKLAYLINKESEGYYVLVNFESEPDFPAELDRVYKITDGVLRSLIIKKDE